MKYRIRVRGHTTVDIEADNEDDAINQVDAMELDIAWDYDLEEIKED